ncbi:unnamed protein product, partial [Mesorhabditis spiculigera]
MQEDCAREELEVLTGTPAPTMVQRRFNLDQNGKLCLEPLPTNTQRQKETAAGKEKKKEIKSDSKSDSKKKEKEEKKKAKLNETTVTTTTQERSSMSKPGSSTHESVSKMKHEKKPMSPASVRTAVPAAPSATASTVQPPRMPPVKGEYSPDTTSYRQPAPQPAATHWATR